MIKPVLCTEAVKRLPLVETPNSPVFFVEKHGSLKQKRTFLFDSPLKFSSPQASAAENFKGVSNKREALQRLSFVLQGFARHIRRI